MRITTTDWLLLTHSLQGGKLLYTDRDTEDTTFEKMLPYAYQVSLLDIASCAVEPAASGTATARTATITPTSTASGALPFLSARRWYWLL
jgi:hypothetical protein